MRTGTCRIQGLVLASTGVGVATDPETDVGSQLFTTGRVPAAGGNVGEGVGSRKVGAGVGVGVGAAVGVAVGLWLAGDGEAGRPAAWAPQP
jgi:hypothetical protein